MEFKNCEEYVLTELLNAQKLIETLTKQLNEKDLEIQALEMKLEQINMEKYHQLSIEEILDMDTFLDNGGLIKVE